MSKYAIKECGDGSFPETRGRSRKFPFEELDVDECFDVPVADGVTLQSLSANAQYWKRKMNDAARKAGHKANINFAVRTLDQDGKRFIRVKRTS